MKNILIIVLLVVAGSLFAQCPIAVGEAQFNIGVGLSSWGVPVYAGMDFGAARDFTLGGELSYNSYHENNDNHHNEYDHSIIGISGNGNYHFNRVLNIPSNWDFYAGLNLGYYIWDSPDDYDGDHTSGLGLGLQVGGRFYFTDSAGINLEFGGGNAFSGGKVGLSVRL